MQGLEHSHFDNGYVVRLYARRQSGDMYISVSIGLGQLHPDDQNQILSSMVMVDGIERVLDVLNQSPNGTTAD